MAGAVGFGMDRVVTRGSAAQKQRAGKARSDVMGETFCRAQQALSQGEHLPGGKPIQAISTETGRARRRFIRLMRRGERQRKGNCPS